MPLKLSSHKALEQLYYMSPILVMIRYVETEHAVSVMIGSLGHNPATYDNVFNVADWFHTLREAAGGPQPFAFEGPANEGSSFLSSVSHWNNLRGQPSTSSPPRGPHELMLYNHDAGSSAARYESVF